MPEMNYEQLIAEVEALRAENARLRAERECQPLETILDSAERLRVIMELASDYAYQIRVEPDESLVTEWIADSVTRILGYSVAELSYYIDEETEDSLVHPDDMADVEAAHTLLLEGKPASAEYRVYTKTGQYRWIRNTMRPLWDEAQGRVVRVIGVAQDITERRRLEEQLYQAQKMESVGRLAGGVAHDFNNLLTAILGYTELAGMDLPAESLEKGYLNNVLKAAERAANLTQQLLAFARKQIIEPKVVSLNDLMLEVDNLLRRLIGEDIEMVALPARDLWPVRVDPGQMEQVIVNLAVNARDAMPEGGRLTIEMANVAFDAEYARQHADVLPGEYVLLAVSDTGLGMAAEVRARVFEPFFTTKGPGKGTGLGLATCYGIVKQNHGHIWVYSEPGQGSCFKVYLPRAEAPPAASTLPESAGALPRGTETILLVEDEPLVRAMALQTLRTQGYRVLEASNGSEALRVAQDTDQGIHLLVTDVVMPQMGGRELAERLRALLPPLKVLFTSGYTDNTIVHHGVLDAGVAFISKPFTPAALARRVREALDSA